jgi:hypothetical protein
MTSDNEIVHGGNRSYNESATAVLQEALAEGLFSP